MDVKPDQYEIEHSKEQLSFFRHLTTLSTGSIVLIATFLEKVFSNPCSTWLVVLAIGMFLVAIVLSSGCQMLTLAMMRYTSTSKNKLKYRKVSHIFLYLVIGSFLLAIISMGVFTVANLLG